MRQDADGAYTDQLQEHRTATLDDGVDTLSLIMVPLLPAFTGHGVGITQAVVP